MYIDPNGRVQIPVSIHPLFRTQIAIQNGVDKNMLFKTWGGLGDQICAEPTLRFAIKKFTNCEVSLAAERPELFSHLSFKSIYDLNKEKPDLTQYYVCDTITPPNDSNMVWLFFSHMLTHCVDFSSMCAYRMQLPIADKEILLRPKVSGGRFWHDVDAYSLMGEDRVFVHPGKHWQSKTFPKEWWDKTILALRKSGKIPVLIGANTDDNRGTVDVCTDGCIDMRNKMSISESIWILQRAYNLITNDSAPLHMAASRDPLDNSTGNCRIGFIATCKHPDYISHWRHGRWSYNMKNLGLGGAWETVNLNPNQGEKVEIEFVDPKVLDSWLPSSDDVLGWVNGS